MLIGLLLFAIHYGLLKAWTGADTEHAERSDYSQNLPNQQIFPMFLQDYFLKQQHQKGMYALDVQQVNQHHYQLVALRVLLGPHQFIASCYNQDYG